MFQVNGKCPTVSIDKTDGCQVYLSKVSVSCEIVSAKSSEMNICVPKGTDGEFVSLTGSVFEIKIRTAVVLLVMGHVIFC